MIGSVTPWGSLFERAAEYDTSEGDVREALAARRDEQAEGEAPDE